MDHDVLIIGGGISGLAVARGLAQCGIGAEVWEADDRAGGKVRSRHEQGYLTERAASLLLNYRPEVDRFIEQAGLSPYKIGQQTARDGRRYLVQDGRLRTVPKQMSAMLLSNLWSGRAKLRMIGEAFVPARSTDGESVAQFIARRLGREMLDKAIDPFVAGTLASDPNVAEARATLPRLTALEERYGSISMGVLVNRILRRRTAHIQETFSFRDGMQRLTDSLVSTPGASVRTGIRAQELIPIPGGWRVIGKGQAGSIERRVRRLVLSVPAPQAAALLAPLSPEAGRLLTGIDYAPLTVVHLGVARAQVRHPLDGTGFLTPRREQLNINGNLWLGSLFPGRAPAGHTLLTSYVGGARHPGRADWDDERLLAAVMSDLGPLIGLSGDPDYLRLDRHPQALPQYRGHYSARLRALDACLVTLPGLDLAANFKGGVSIRDRIAQGLATATRIHQALAADTDPSPMPLTPCPGTHR